MKYERILNRTIWAITGSFFVLAIILEFNIDKFFIKRWFEWMSGHRDFAINITLGGFASGIITGITTWATFENKKQDVKERINRYLCDVQRSFNGYCDSISQKDYKTLLIYMENFENAMTDFINCYHSNNYKNKKYADIEKIYCQRIIQYSTVIMIYDSSLKSNEDGNEELLFSDLSKNILSNAKYDFDKALSAVLGTRDIERTDMIDDEMWNQIKEIRKHYFMKKTEEQD